MFKVVIMPVAEADIAEAFQWWHDNRSLEQAHRWYLEIYPAIASLSESAGRRPLSPEAAKLGMDIREIYFGIGLHPTHRVVFFIEKGTVKVLRVRHLARGHLRPSDL